MNPDTMPKCYVCGKPATCLGRYENQTEPDTYACDDCCGHGNEDGHCKPIAPPTKWAVEKEAFSRGLRIQNRPWMTQTESAWQQSYAPSWHEDLEYRVHPEDTQAAPSVEDSYANVKAGEIRNDCAEVPKACPKCGGVRFTGIYPKGVLRSRYWACLSCSFSTDQPWPKSEQPPAGATSAGQTCPLCSSPEVDAMTPRTVYSCGSSDYDQRPGTFKKGADCQSQGVGGEREAFEKWANSLHASLRLPLNWQATYSVYYDTMTQCAWEGWQARAALNVEGTGVSVPT